MLEFKGRDREDEFQIFFAEQHLTWDLFVYSTFGLISPTALLKFWKNNHVRSPLWYAVFLSCFLPAKGIPVYLITKHWRWYVRHRTAMALAMRLLELFISCAYYSFWIDVSDHNVFSEWLLLACIFPNGWMGALIWGMVQPVPNRVWLNIQVIDLARMFVYNPTTLSQLEGGLHHIAPLVRVVNALVIPLGAPPISARNQLFLMWLVQEVVGGFVLPFLLTYRIQLRSRRLWRKGVLKQLRADSQAHSNTQANVLPKKDSGLDIRPTWTLFLPESLAFLTLSYVAGENFRLLQYMV